MPKKNERSKTTQIDDLNERTNELMNQLASEYPHLRQAGRSSSATASKLKNVEDKLVGQFADGLRKAWSSTK